MILDMLSPDKIHKTKLWINNNKSEFPKTLDGLDRYYADVIFTVDQWLHQLDSKDPIQSTMAYNNLRQLYKDLQIKENWNKPMKRICE